MVDLHSSSSCWDYVTVREYIDTLNQLQLMKIKSNPPIYGEYRNIRYQYII
jgi:hypothetical protein